MFKVPVIQALYGLSDAQAAFQIMDRRSFGRFLSLNDGARAPDETTIRRFREALVRWRNSSPGSTRILRTRDIPPWAGASRLIGRPVFGCKSHINADRRHGFVRTIGFDRARTRIGMANIAFNMKCALVTRFQAADRGLQSVQLSELKALEKENRRFRKIVADLELDKLILKESLDFSKPNA